MKHLHHTVAMVFLLLLIEKVNAQDLDPRAYIWVPVRVSTFVAGFGYSYGGVITDPTIPIEDLQATIESPSLSSAHTFSLFGRTAQVSAALPYAWAQASAMVGGISESTTRSGLSDIRFRFSMLLLGAPAATPEELAKSERKTILGTSLAIVTPTGQYFPERLINLGTSRWSFKPEVALSQPLGSRWLIDLYTGIWLFTKNDSFYPGNSVRTQNPLFSFQAHISYNIRPRMWAALDVTDYIGGMSSVDGVDMNDRQSNSRIGATLVLPVGKRHSVKIACSTGAIIRFGANFTTFSIGWQTSFVGRPGKAESQSL